MAVVTRSWISNRIWNSKENIILEIYMKEECVIYYFTIVL